MSQSYTRGVPIDPDPTLSNNSNLLVASQQAVKTYVDLLTQGYLARHDFVAPYSYCGTAPIGSSEAAAVWTIFRITCNDDGSVVIMTASSVNWTNRYTHIYV